MTKCPVGPKCRHRQYLVPLLLFVACGHHIEQYSVMESAPYISYGTGVAPDANTGPAGINLGFGGFYSSTRPENGTAQELAGFDFLAAARVMEAAEIGYSFSTFIAGQRLRTFHEFGGRVTMGHAPLVAGPALGFGAGFGEAGLLGSIKFSFIIGLSPLGENLCFYAAPRLVALYYPWKREYYEYQLGWNTSYALCPLYGLSGGISWSVPIGDSRFKLKPELSLLFGKEPQLTKTDLRVLYPSCEMIFAF